MVEPDFKIVEQHVLKNPVWLRVPSRRLRAQRKISPIAAESPDDRDLTSVATWQSSNAAVTTVSATTGVLTVVRDGESTITATYQGKSGAKVLAFQNPSPWDY